MRHLLFILPLLLCLPARAQMEHHHPPEQTPVLPGQDAFGAIQEIEHILLSDPHTDWSKVDLDRLRVHLIDMNEVTLHAAAAVTRIKGGIAADVTGQGRTLEAINRMVPAQAGMLNGTPGWAAKAESLPNGVRLTVTSGDSRQVTIIQGLGFIGVMASGAHHQQHHLAIATGAMVH